MNLLAAIGARIKSAEKAVTWWRHTIRDRRRMRAIYKAGGIPVVVYSMTKVGSMSVYRALQKRRDTLALKGHALDPAAWNGSRTDSIYKPGVRAAMFDLTHSNRMVRFEIIDAKKPCRFIALARDPVATNVSGFHYNLPSFAADRRAHERADSVSAAEMVQLFLARYPHHLALDWFDLEPKRILDIDVYATPFPHEKGWLILRHGPNEMLVMRTELADDEKGRVISDFLGIPDVRIGRVNTAAERGRSGSTDAFKRELASHPQYIDEMLGSKYACHFWTASERSAMRNKWIPLGDTLRSS
ncbi:MAG: hypothetical protein EXS17_08750 [Phycisphaerales bacterium]|nr:hypothetical protein [Phycisphaerales bacterium]